MQLTVLSVAFAFAAVGPHAVGGAEKILTDLDEALSEAGHQSLVVACEGSRTKGQLFSFPLPLAGTVDEAVRREVPRHSRNAVQRALRSGRVDVVHLHGMDFDAYDLPEDIPIVVTLHLPLGWYAPGALERWRERARFVCVSESQRSKWPAALAGRSDVVVVENGVAIPEQWNSGPRENFALVLGRICPEKNQHEALAAGTMAGIPVLIGGHTFPYREHQAYFAEKIAPVLASNERSSRPQHRFLESLRPDEKRDLLSRAKCVLHPTRAPETSSLVAMEALAAGTPVIAYRSGALPEIVEDGVTGFLVDDVQGMAEAIGKVDTISRSRCRAAAERRFSKQRMVRQYLGLYESMTGSRSRRMQYA
ncbi:MAG TPA: glycosyltransferase [Acidobacteriaceae bacterium]|nr:glycosyltransferase [Acidobacteriaceae bacterium]